MPFWACTPLRARLRDPNQASCEKDSKKPGFRPKPFFSSLLGISPKTVATHRSNIMRELSIREVAGLVRYAVRYRLIDP